MVAFHLLERAVGVFRPVHDVEGETLHDRRDDGVASSSKVNAKTRESARIAERAKFDTTYVSSCAASGMIGATNDAARIIEARDVHIGQSSAFTHFGRRPIALTMRFSIGFASSSVGQKLR